MRRFLLPALMISLLLTGCGSLGAEGKLKDRRESLAEAGEISFTADVTANLGSEVFDCTLNCTWTPEKLRLEVTAPESIAGIRTEFSDGKLSLGFGDVLLGVGTAEDGEITPVSAVPMLISALQSGFFRKVWRERDGETALLAADIYLSETGALTVWFAEDSLNPVHAEFSQEGSTVLKSTIRDFTYR